VTQTAALLYQFGDLFEVDVVGGFEQLEEGHFGAGDIYAERLHFGYCNLFIIERPGRYGIGNHIYNKALFLQVNGRLVNTDVGFYAGEQYLRTVC
jgi:hypothetical protein